jgi:hypothetical protein
MREFAAKVKSLDAGHWITIATVLLAATLQYGNTTAQISELSRGQVRLEQSQGRNEAKLDGVIAEQARVKQQLEDHIQMTEQNFRELGKK